MAVTAYLTGRVRTRVKHRFMREPLLILQVEEDVEHFEPKGTDVISFSAVRWRDARPGDVLPRDPSFLLALDQRLRVRSKVYPHTEAPVR